MVFSVGLSLRTLSAAYRKQKDGLDPTISRLAPSATLPLQGHELDNCVVGFEVLSSVYQLKLRESVRSEPLLKFADRNFLIGRSWCF